MTEENVSFVCVAVAKTLFVGL